MELLSDFGIFCKLSDIRFMTSGRATTDATAVQTLLKEMRTDAGIRQSELAATLNVPQSFVSKYEAGERRLDLIETRRICHALGMSLAEFAERLESKLTGRN